MLKTKRFNSFMISDILERNESAHDVQRVASREQISLIEYNLLESYANGAHEMPICVNPHNHYLWSRSLQTNLAGCQQQMPTADTIVWQHYLLKQRMLMQAKPRKGGQIRFTTEQSVTLEKQFDRQKYLSPPERKKIATQLGLTERQIKTWFQNRRAKWRRCKQFSEDKGDDKNILYNKYEDTHACSHDNDNDDECDNIENYEFESNVNDDAISGPYNVINFS